MAHRRHRLTLLFLCLACVGVCLLHPATAWAFGEEGVFHPRVLRVGNAVLDRERLSAPVRLSMELMKRTNAKARVAPVVVSADSPLLWDEPFVWWFGAQDTGELSSREIAGIRTFLALGGVVLVDDSDPAVGAFGRSVRRELARVLPDVAPVPMGAEHVVFRSYYLLERSVGRVRGPGVLEAWVRNGQAQVLLLSHDLAGALARDRSGLPSFAMEPGDDMQREMAIRLAVNVAMFVLCSNYKDDQVHAPFLMRRRVRDR